MGNACKGQAEMIQVTQLRIQRPSQKEFIKINNESNRLNGQIQKLKSNANMRYKLILPIQSSSRETRTVQIDFLLSYSDLELYQPYQFEIIDDKMVPIIDHFEEDYQQVYHKILLQGKVKSMKYYNFRNLQDYSLKSALYEISMYQTLRPSSLQNYFIIHRTEQKQLVMIFKYFQVSLHDVILFRKATNFHWTQKQILSIGKMIINSYRKMSLNGIVHRDIRPSNIFFCPSINKNNESNIYQISNLSSARFFKETFQNGSHQPQEQMLTLKGVPAFTSNPISNALLSDEAIMAYNPQKKDLQGLQLTLYSMIYLNVYNKDKSLSKCEGKIKQLMSYFKNPQINVQKLNQKIQNLVGASSIFGSQLLEKDRTICQKIEKSLYFNSRDSSQLITQIYVNSLFDLHKKDVFVPYMMQKINTNYQKKDRRANVDLFLKLGDYFAKNGVNDNQYYREAIKLILDIALSSRISGFYPQHSQTLKQAEEVNDKLKFQNQSNKEIKALYLKQKAYQAYYNYSQKLSERQRKTQALRQINQSVSICSQIKNIPIEEQLDILYAKGELQLLNSGWQEAQPFFQEGLEISSQNRNFKSKALYNFYKGLFEYGTAMAKIQGMRSNQNDVRPKTIAKIQEYLNKAKQRFQSVLVPVIYLIKCYMANSDLYYLRQDYETSKKTSQRALTLLDAQNQKSTQISTEIQLQIVNKLILTLDKQDKYQSEYTKYVKKKEELKKTLKRQSKSRADINISNRKSSQKSSRKNKSRRQSQRSSLRSSQSQKQKQFRRQGTKQSKLDIIHEQEQMKQMIESRKSMKRKQMQRQSLRQSQKLKQSQDNNSQGQEEQEE